VRRQGPIVGGGALAVAGLTLAAFVLRLPSLGRSLWLDEAWRANIALEPSWRVFWNQILGSGGGSIGAPMPPLFALALRAVGVVVGHSAAGMRAFPVAASVAVVPLAYLVGRRADGVTAGLVAALCFACAPAALVNGQELKQYSTDIAVVLTLLLATSAVAARPFDRRPWLALAAAAGLAPGLSYPAALVLPGVALATLAACRSNGDRLRWLAAQAASGVAALAWYAFVIGPQRARPHVTAYWAGDFPPLEGVPRAGWVAGQLLDFFAYACGRPGWLAAAVTVAGLVLAARWLGLVALGALVTLVAAAAWRVYPLSGGRTTVFMVAFVHLGLGVAVGAGARALARGSRRAPGTLVRGALAAVAAGLVLMLAARGIRNPQAGTEYEETAPLIAVLAAARQPTDRVYVYDGAVQAFRFHHPASDPLITLGGSHRKDAAAYPAELRPLLVPGQRLWLLFSHVHTPASGKPERDTILGDVSLYGRQVDVREAPGATLHLFEITRAPGTVRHLQLTPEDLRDPEKMKKLFGQ
jgi:4-amino-4-deoxy-L-arabinose transferase-like glycosyltransferase